MNRRLVLAHAAVLSTLALATGALLPSPAEAAAVTVRIGPPPPRVERVPAPRPGFVWTVGHWEWRSNRHVWIPGSWVRARPGYRYRQPQWQRVRGDWVYARGGWDRDRDGVPNRFDRRPGDPRRR